MAWGFLYLMVHLRPDEAPFYVYFPTTSLIFSSILMGVCPVYLRVIIVYHWGRWRVPFSCIVYRILCFPIMAGDTVTVGV